jgi:hypothetical protein
MKSSFKGIWIPAEIWLDHTLTAQEKCILAEIHSLDHKQGCTASNRHFARHFGLTEKHVSRLISHLREGGFVEVEVDREAGNVRTLRAPRYANKSIPTGIQADTPAFRKSNAIPVDAEGLSAPMRGPTESLQEKNSFKNQFRCVGHTHTPVKNEKNEKAPRRFAEQYGDNLPLARLELLERFPQYQNINVVHYIKKAANWSDSKNKSTYDWLAQIADFIENDRVEGKLQFAAQPSQAGNPLIIRVEHEIQHLTAGSFEDFQRRIEYLAGHYLPAVEAGMKTRNPAKAIQMVEALQSDPEAALAYYTKHQRHDNGRTVHAPATAH